MDRIKAFISYSSLNKYIGGELKQHLTTICGYEPFIAHDDIPGSEIWEKEILKAIKTTDFFIPLISKQFKISDFADQETGLAVCLNKKIIPIKLDTINPYGFINKYQALQYKQHSIMSVVIAIARIGLHNEPTSIYYKKSLQSLVYALCESKSFETTNTIIQILSTCHHQFSAEQTQQIIEAIRTNSQIIGAFGLRDLKQILRTTYHCSLD